MTVAAVLVGYAAAVGTLGSRLLGRARWPDRAVIRAQLGQVTPCPDEGLLHDVFRARRVRAVLFDVAAQGLGVERVQLADDGISVAV